MKRSFFLILFLVLFSTGVNAESFTNKDSSEVSTKVSDFFNWYLTAIDEQQYKEFQPRFVEDKNGMTTLDYSIYMANLKKYHFSDSLIQTEKQYYQKCIENLEKIKYSDFNTKYTDLDQFEDIDCDFGNSYRWTGGQEAPDKMKIIKVEFKNNDTAFITVSYGSSTAGDDENSYWGNLIVSMKKIAGLWKITNL
jgi:hypothetical protein